jgi:hypothetical protein
MSAPYDPTLPLDGSLISANELRTQMVGLQALSADATNSAEQRAFKPTGVADLSGLTISNPPTQAQVTAIRDKLNELISELQI